MQPCCSTSGKSNNNFRCAKYLTYKYQVLQVFQLLDGILPQGPYVDGMQ